MILSQFPLLAAHSETGCALTSFLHFLCTECRDRRLSVSGSQHADFIAEANCSASGANAASATSLFPPLPPLEEAELSPSLRPACSFPDMKIHFVGPTVNALINEILSA
jgi:hypothetical protein